MRVVVCVCESVQGSSSKYARLKPGDVDAFLASMCPNDRDDAIHKFFQTTCPEDVYKHIVFNELIPATEEQIEETWKAPQKSEGWHAARFCRKTGSDSGTLLGLNPYSNPL